MEIDLTDHEGGRGPVNPAATDPEAVRRTLIELVDAALDAAGTPEELVDCARAAVAVGDADLSARVAARVADQIREVAAGASAWHMQTLHSKLEAWQKTGRRARHLAEAWSLVGGTQRTPV